MKKLSKQITITEETLHDYNEELHQDIADTLNEYLSDVTGFCHKGFRFEIRVKNIKWDTSN